MAGFLEKRRLFLLRRGPPRAAREFFVTGRPPPLTVHKKRAAGVALLASATARAQTNLRTHPPAACQPRHGALRRHVGRRSLGGGAVGLQEGQEKTRPFLFRSPPRHARHAVPLPSSPLTPSFQQTNEKKNTELPRQDRVHRLPGGRVGGRPGQVRADGRQGEGRRESVGVLFSFFPLSSLSIHPHLPPFLPLSHSLSHRASPRPTPGWTSPSCS
jgi:hypothetical protein